MSHVAMGLLPELRAQGIEPQIIDLVAYSGVNNEALAAALADCQRVLLLQEALPNGGIEPLLRELSASASGTRFEHISAQAHYSFEIGSRESIHAACGLGREQILQTILNG
jgi:deoxyxylulose-5-phosphate synthase